MASPSSLPVGKLPPDLLAKILSGAPLTDPRVLLGPGVGLDCAVVDLGDRMLVFKSDPITFASEDIGWYAVQVCANDVATTGAEPRWLLATALLPEDHTPPELAEKIAWQIFEACRELGISVIGGHTEITHGIDRPILSCTMIGEVQAGRLVTPRGAVPGDRLLLTKGVPVEAVSIIAREFADRLGDLLSLAEVEDACRHLYNPGISVVLDARLATRQRVGWHRLYGSYPRPAGTACRSTWMLCRCCRWQSGFVHISNSTRWLASPQGRCFWRWLVMMPQPSAGHWSRKVLPALRSGRYAPARPGSWLAEQPSQNCCPSRSVTN
jgi:hypothetical protein